MPDQKGVRAWLVDQLKPLTPKPWAWVPYDRQIGVASSTVCMLKLSDVRRAPEAPQGAYLTEWTLTIVSPHDDPDRAQADLDDTVPDLLFAIEKAGIRWTAARRVLFQDRNQAFDITLNCYAQKE